MLCYFTPSRRHFGCTAIAQGRLPEIARQSGKPKEHGLPACVLFAPSNGFSKLPPRICGGLRCRAGPRGKPRLRRSFALPAPGSLLHRDTVPPTFPNDLIGKVRAGIFADDHSPRKSLTLGAAWSLSQPVSRCPQSPFSCTTSA
jgi:hypothetical protein